MTEKPKGKCAKVVVRCTIVSPNGERFIGENWVRKPQKSCPREAGEGYDKCRTVCDQYAHAELDAIEHGGFSAIGGTAYVEFLRDRPGHVCDDCARVLGLYGISWVLGPPPG